MAVVIPYVENRSCLVLASATGQAVDPHAQQGPKSRYPETQEKSGPCSRQSVGDLVGKIALPCVRVRGGDSSHSQVISYRAMLRVAIRGDNSENRCWRWLRGQGITSG